MQATNDAQTQHVSPGDLENGIIDSNREQGSTREVPEQQILTFPPNDPENPLNWSTPKKSFILLLGAIAIFNSVLDSALPSGSIAGLKKAYNVTSTTQQVLPISVFLFGYVLGPLCFGPLSETFGRRVVMVPTFAIFVLATGAQGLIPACMSDEGVRIRGDCEGRWTGFLFLRLLAGINAASSIAVVGGIYADVFKGHQARGWAVGVMILMTTVGPQLAPPIAGFLLPISWRWTYYMGVIIAFASFIPMLFLPETYGPILLKRRAKKLRQEPGNEHIFAKIELEKRGWKRLVGVVLMRPLRMFFTEPIVFVCCVYLSLVNGLLFLCFQGYPRVFQNIYGMNAGVAGLAYLPIALGAFLAFLLMLLYDNRLSHYKLQNQTLNSSTPQSQSQSQLQLQLQLQKPWLTNESYRRLPLACLGGPCYVLAIFWFGWTSTSTYDAIIPILSGIPFGMGYFLIFTSLLNYLTDAYKQYAASALSAAAISRSLVGALLPIAAGRMYDTLGVGWGESLLGFVALVMCGVPFLFIGFGERIRGGSRMFRELEGLG